MALENWGQAEGFQEAAAETRFSRPVGGGVTGETAADDGGYECWTRPAGCCGIGGSFVGRQLRFPGGHRSWQVAAANNAHSNSCSWTDLARCAERPQHIARTRQEPPEEPETTHRRQEVADADNKPSGMQRAEGERVGIKKRCGEK